MPNWPNKTSKFNELNTSLPPLLSLLDNSALGVATKLWFFCMQPNRAWHPNERSYTALCDQQHCFRFHLPVKMFRVRIPWSCPQACLAFRPVKACPSCLALNVLHEHIESLVLPWLLLHSPQGGFVRSVCV